jgi:hypothetical protein
MADENFDPLCELEFTETQTGKKVTARLGSPIFDPTNDWYCLNEIAGLEEGKRARTYGVDPFQAIVLSLKRFRIIFEKEAGEFRSLMGSSPYTIFPKGIPWEYGSDVYQKLYKMVNDEVQKIEDELTRRRESRNRKDEK